MRMLDALESMSTRVDHIDDIEKMYKLGADGVFTGYPERVIENYTQADFSTRWCDQ